MAKIVYSSSREISHLWANQTQHEARTPKQTFWFKDNKAYSYSTQIGEIHPERGIVILSTQHHSNTTRKHQGYLRNAIPPQYRVIDIGVSVFRHESVVSEFARKHNQLLEKLAKATKPAKYIIEIQEQYKHTEKYLKFMVGLDDGEFSGLGQRERVLEDLIKVISQQWEVLQSGNSKALAKTHLEEKQKVERAKVEARKEEHEKSVKEWREHARDTILHAGDLRSDIIRLTRGEVVMFQSQQGVKIKQSEGLALYKLATSIKNGGEKPSQQVSIAGFEVLGFYDNGNIEIGCHSFEYEELQRAFDLLAVNLI